MARMKKMWAVLLIPVVLIACSPKEEWPFRGSLSGLHGTHTLFAKLSPSSSDSGYAIVAWGDDNTGWLICDRLVSQQLTCGGEESLAGMGGVYSRFGFTGQYDGSSWTGNYTLEQLDEEDPEQVDEEDWTWIHYDTGTFELYRRAP